MSKIFVIIPLFFLMHTQQKALILLTLLYLSLIVSDSNSSSLILYCTTMHQKIHSLYVDIFLPFSFFLSIIQFYYTLIISFLIKTQLLTVKVVDKRHKFYNNFRKLLFQFSRTLPDPKLRQKRSQDSTYTKRHEPFI